MRRLPAIALISLALMGAASVPGAAPGQPSSPPQSAAAAIDAAAIAASLRPLLKAETFEQRLADVGRLKAAGFVFQPELAVSGESCPQNANPDQRAGLSGMLAADRGFAFFFGTPAQAARANTLLAEVLGMTPPTLSEKDRSALRNPAAPESRRVLVRFCAEESHRILETAARDEASLRLVGAYLYGLFLEQTYLSSVMILAAAESETLAPLRGLHTDLSRNQAAVLDILGKARCLGPDADTSDERAGAARQIIRYLNNGAPTLNGLRAAVEITQTERGAFLAPCPLDAAPTRMQ
mgnify:FL=1